MSLYETHGQERTKERIFSPAWWPEWEQDFCPNKIRYPFVGPSTIIILKGKNEVEAILTEGFSRKHPVFPVILVKTYHQTDDDKIPNKKNIFTHEKLVEEDYLPGTLKKNIKARKIMINGKDNRQYLLDLRIKQKIKMNGYLNETSQMDKFTSKESEPLGQQQILINDEPSFEGGYISL
ncbi:hypothetical protein O181_087068 [Austropuccinia psidii MF-1]|uniref:Uncharacterized protein n=1 Tax=Austropuccinia psidii MF-1 TaxID=1389203 RepID=A0A9Q3P0I7_9BASI|nr:hypothetical protein [Austropuccinia psidii MF-1]